MKNSSWYFFYRQSKNEFKKHQTRTNVSNKSVEVWHKNFESDCKKHPTVYGLVNKFKDEQGLTDAILDQIEAGDCYYKRGDVVLKEEKLKLLCKSYSNNGKFVDYLTSISYNL